ncbi:hypothetical protein PHMEG_00016126 [Phytophthora megakarya]|uniref:Reverse transcriptase n=1 Tax=Phytophthora megakarya TaxID=4795 RepID=A0A225VZJ8_9STRA|nr:hypothetical protein PHMEG_00016126 [Phytophthora megakarya]
MRRFQPNDPAGTGRDRLQGTGLTLLRRKGLDRLMKWSDHELLHNGRVGSLASAALQRQGGIEVHGGPEHQDLVTLHRMDEILVHKTNNPVVRVPAVTTRASRVMLRPGAMQEDPIREMRVGRIRQAQEEAVWIIGMKKYMSGSIVWDLRSKLEATIPVGCTRRRDQDPHQITEIHTVRFRDRLGRPGRASFRDHRRYVVHRNDLEGATVALSGSTALSVVTVFPLWELGSDGMWSIAMIWNGRRWRYRSRKQVNARLREVIADRTSRHNEGVGSHRIEAGSRGYARKLVHLWHEPFRVAEKINEFTIKLEIAGTGYQIFPVVHVSKLRLVREIPDRPRVELTVNESDRLDFDEVLLPKDSWVPDLGADDYQVEQISDVRSGKKT